MTKTERKAYDRRLRFAAERQAKKARPAAPSKPVVEHLF
jgi:hypothetical protein